MWMFSRLFLLIPCWFISSSLQTTRDLCQSTVKVPGKPSSYAHGKQLQSLEKNSIFHSSALKTQRTTKQDRTNKLGKSEANVYRTLQPNLSPRVPLVQRASSYFAQKFLLRQMTEQKTDTFFLFVCFSDWFYKANQHILNE